ncbi:MAG: 30S ribosomal protein S12 methylthiotransferase RimO, partial [Prochlorococcus sp.]
ASNSRLIGQTVEVLIEQLQPETGQMIGRCARFAPEIDGEVQVSGGEAAVQASPGTMLPVRITGADIYDLSGEIVAAGPMVAAERTGS